MSERVEPTTPEVAFAADVLRAPEAVPPEVRARLAARLAVTLALPAPAPAPTPAIGSGTMLVTGLVIGLVIGRLTAWDPTPPRDETPPPTTLVALATTAPPAPHVAPPPVAPPPIAPVIAPIVVDPPPARPRAHAERRADDTAVEAVVPDPAPVLTAESESEEALLEDARLALRAGDPSRALTLLAAHESAFQNGALVEEREALAVRALLTSHRDDEARARAERFVARYPHSIFSSVVRPAL